MQAERDGGERLQKEYWESTETVQQQRRINLDDIKKLSMQALD